jgi:hypothetical protein
MSIENLIEKHSSNKELSLATLKLIREIGNKTVETFNLFDDASSPVIAGGSIRDCVLGLEPNDFDIFVPNFIREDEYPITYLDFILEGLQIPCVRILKLDHEDYYKQIGQTPKLKNVYEGFSDKNEHYLGDNGIHSPIIQIIEPHTFIDKQHVEYIEKEFDYDLVKCAYDCRENSFWFSDDFIKAVENKRTFSASRRRYGAWFFNRGFVLQGWAGPE